MAHAYAHLFAIPVTAFRFFTVYGPWGRPDMAYFRFTRAILSGQPIEVYNHGRMSRDFTFVDDLVEGILRLTDVVPVAGPTAPLGRAVPHGECGTREAAGIAGFHRRHRTRLRPHGGPSAAADAAG